MTTSDGPIGKAIQDSAVSRSPLQPKDQLSSQLVSASLVPLRFLRFLLSGSSGLMSCSPAHGFGNLRHGCRSAFDIGARFHQFLFQPRQIKRRQGDGLVAILLIKQADAAVGQGQEIE